MRSFLVVTLCTLLSAVSCTNTDKPHVTTPLGRINGQFKSSYGGRQYAAYESIPYALPPIGDLRFEPPVPVPAWSKPIDALHLPKPCSQFAPQLDEKTAGVEDCLYLNIYIPVRNKTGSLPVLFWIHGGGFQYGASAKFRAKFLMDKESILVTVNYRLGPFGFLSTGDNIVPGNMGLKDQSLALRWVSENIKYFGGNSKKITLIGVSAGGASVHYHYLSPLSAGLFQNGISFSGTAFARWAFATDTWNTTKTLARTLNCSLNESHETIQCLKKVSAKKINLAIANLLGDFYFPFAMFPPVAEKVENNYFINDSPKNIIEQGRGLDLPWIAGVVSEEGLFFTAGYALKEDLVKHADENWETVAPYMLHFTNGVPKYKHAELVNLAKAHYFGNKHFSTNRDSMLTLTHMVGDDQIVTGAIRAAKLHARVNKSPVHFYYYSYRATQSYTDFITNTTENLGVCHMDDILLVLENEYMDPTTTASDRNMLQDMLNFWHSVVSTGSPDLGTQWNTLNASSSNFEYMHIAGPGNFTMKSNNNLGEIKFWNQIGL